MVEPLKPLSPTAGPARIAPGAQPSPSGRGTPSPAPRAAAATRLELALAGIEGEELLLEGGGRRLLLAAEGETLAVLRRTAVPGRSVLTLLLPRGGEELATAARLVAVDGEPVDLPVTLRRPAAPTPPRTTHPPTTGGEIRPDIGSAVAAGSRRVFEATVPASDGARLRLAVTLEPARPPPTPGSAPASGPQSAATPSPPAASRITTSGIVPRPATGPPPSPASPSTAPTPPAAAPSPPSARSPESPSPVPVFSTEPPSVTKSPSPVSTAPSPATSPSTALGTAASPVPAPSPGGEAGVAGPATRASAAPSTAPPAAAPGTADVATVTAPPAAATGMSPVTGAGGGDFRTPLLEVGVRVAATVVGRDAAGRLVLRLAGDDTPFLRIEEPGLEIPAGSRLVLRVDRPPTGGTDGDATARVTSAAASPGPPPTVTVAMGDRDAALRLFAYLLRRAVPEAAEKPPATAARTEPPAAAPPPPASATAAPTGGSLVWLAGGERSHALRIGERREGEDEAGGEGGRRWLFALELAAFGALRLELWARGAGRQLAVRSERPLPGEVRGLIADMFGAALEISGNRGWLIFTGLSGEEAAAGSGPSRGMLA